VRRSARILLIAALIVHALFLASLVEPGHFLNPLFPEGMHNLEEGQGSDFFAFYQAGRYVLDGEDIYRRPMDDPDRVVPYGYFYRYLPFSAFTLGVAANALPPWPAYWTWIVIVEVILGLSILATRRLVDDATLFGYLAAMWLMFTPFYIEQYMGQLTFVMSALIFAFALAHARGRRAASDWSWILSVLIKHVTVLYAPILVRVKRYRPIVLAAVLLVASTVPYYLLRPADTGRFQHDNFSLNLYPFPGNFGALALVMVLKNRFLPTASEPLFYVGPLMVSLTRIALLAVMLVPALWALWITFRRRPFDFVESLSLWTMVYFFVFREVWEYHYVLLMPVLVLLYAKVRARVLWVIYALLAAPTLFVLYDVPGQSPEVSWSAFEHVVNHSFKVVPLVWLFTWVAIGCYRRHLKRAESNVDGGLVAAL
jgi:hypothetical protein